MSGAGRRWLELSVRCRAAGDRGALLADALLLVGGRAAVERGGWYVTYVEDPGDVDRYLSEAMATLREETGLEPIETRVAWQDHEQWEEAWKRGLGVRRITERLLVRPSWIPHEADPHRDLVIELDPGMAFGTAEHGTTRGCLRLLDRVVRPGDELLDVGAGSGILSVAAALLGAAAVHAIEGDALACEACAENVDRNGVTDRVTITQRWADPAQLRAHPPVDGVVANIEAGILEPLLPALTSLPAAGGWLLLSGILEEEWDDFADEVEAHGVRCHAVDRDEGWVSALFRRPS